MIDELRDEIDRIDEKIVGLLNDRARTALKIGNYKRRKGLSVTDEERERKVLDRVKASNDGPFSNEQLERIYRKLISETKNIQTEVDVDDSRNEAGSN